MAVRSLVRALLACSLTLLGAVFSLLQSSVVQNEEVAEAYIQPWMVEEAWMLIDDYFPNKNLDIGKTVVSFSTDDSTYIVFRDNPEIAWSGEDRVSFAMVDCYKGRGHCELISLELRF